MSKSLKILFVPSGCTPIYPHILDFRPLGGTETALIKISEELAHLGHEVYIYQDIEFEPSASYPRYISKREYEKIRSFDVIVALRDWYELFKPWPATKSFLWTSDSFRSLKSYGIGDKRIAKKIDGLILLSHWHQQTFTKESGFPKNKTHLVHNGVNLDYFVNSEKRHPKRLIYSSAPDRGMMYLPAIFSELKKRYPDAQLHVFSSFDRYEKGWSPGYNPSAPGENFKLYEQLTKINGCTVHGSVLQKQLASEFMKSSILLYPCNYEETSCITAMEAMAGGCAVVTSDLGALKETVGSSGIFIKERPGSDEFIKEFIGQTDFLLKNPERIKKLSSQSQKRALNFSWKASAKEMLNCFEKI